MRLHDCAFSRSVQSGGAEVCKPAIAANFATDGSRSQSNGSGGRCPSLPSTASSVGLLSNCVILLKDEVITTKYYYISTLHTFSKFGYFR